MKGLIFVGSSARKKYNVNLDMDGAHGNRFGGEGGA